MSQRHPHPTKKGPGRYHKDGEPHGTAPLPPKGAFYGVRVATKLKKLRRQAIGEIGGIRQFKKAYRESRRSQQVNVTAGN